MIKLSVDLADAREGRLRQPLFIEDAREIGHAVRQAVDDFVEAHRGALQLPLTIEVHAAPEDATERAFVHTPA